MNELQDNLSRTRERLIHEISALSDHEFNQSVDSHTWSIAQVCHHLVITEILFAKAIISGLDRGHITEAIRKPIELILDRSKKLQAPKIAEPSSERFQVQHILLLLDASRKDFIGVISSIHDKTILTSITVKNPVFGHLPLDQWIELLYLHEQRHIEQIIALKTLRG